jgi:hypothetical protein
MANQMRPDETHSAEHQQAQLPAGPQGPLPVVRRLRLRQVANSNERPAGNNLSLQELTASAD